MRRNATSPGSAARDVASPYQADGAGPAAVPWGSVIIRMFIVVVPAQFIGVFLGGIVIGMTGLMLRHAWAGSLITILGGVAAGVLLGLLVTPARHHRRTYLVLSVAFGVVSYLILLVITQINLPAYTPRVGWTAYVRGPLLIAGIQTLVAGLCWRQRDRTH